MSRVFLKIGSNHNGRFFGAVKDTGSLRAHLKYIGFRSRERYPDDLGFFNDRVDAADWREFYEGIRDHPALQHSYTVKAHKIIFSLREKDYEIYKQSGRDYKDIVRYVMREYEKRKGIKLEWIAVKHDRNSHPHCHVVVRGVSRSEKNEPSKRIYFNKEDIALMKRDFENEVSRYRTIEHERAYLERQPALDLGDVFKGITKAIENEVKNKQRELEYEKEIEQRKRNRGRDR